MKTRQITILSLVILLLLYSLCQSFGQGTVRIGFEGPPEQPPGTNFRVKYYWEAGVLFTARTNAGSSSFTRAGIPEDPWWPDNGSSYLLAALGDSLRFSLWNDGEFDMVSVDLAEFSTLYQEPAAVQFIGYRPDGSTVSRVVYTDGIIDGSGPLPDFQTFYFGSEFTGLTRVEIPNNGWALDNLVLNIPEPATSSLFLVGGLVFWACRGRRRLPCPRLVSPSKSSRGAA